MTERLYYDDSNKREFDASVVRVEPLGDRHAIWLDRTSFYPTTGGQPFDTGFLDSLRVVDVFESAAGDVVHVAEAGPLPARGQRVHGRIDWPRRFDHMQQHTGQHVLSSAFDRLFGVRTVSFHLGAEVSTIDLAREVRAAGIARAEDEANSVVWEDRPVTVRYASGEEVAAMPLRKESTRAGVLRIVEVEHFDLSACGGTHVNRTGAIGVIAIASWERFKGGQRITFVCGGRALARFRNLRETSAAAARLLSVAPQDIPASIERLRAEMRDQQRVLAILRGELTEYRADALTAAAEPGPSARCILKAIDGDANELKVLAAAITARPRLIVVLVSTSTPAVVVVARSRDVSVSCQEVVASLINRFGGRGGGKPDLAQAGGLAGATDAILSESRRLLL